MKSLQWDSGDSSCPDTMRQEYVYEIVNNGSMRLSKIRAKRLTWLAFLCAAPSMAQTKDYIQGHIGGLSNQAYQNVGDVPGNRYNANLSFDYYKDTNTSYSQGIERRFTFAAQVNDQSLTQYSLQEAYVGGRLTNKDYLKFGRQVLNWSQVDQTWGFGKINNRRNFDYFEPGQEGLIGLSFEHKSSNGVRYRSFVSGLYVPEMNPPLDINKGDHTIKSRSAWGNPPARSVEVSGSQKPIEYYVDYPSVSEVVYRYSVGANIGFENKHWVMDNFIIRKPENEISKQVEFRYNTTADVIKINVTPQFYYHDVYGSSLKYRNQDLEMHVSGIAVRPNSFPDSDLRAVQYSEIKSVKRREDYVGGGISKTNDVYGMGLNYVARLSPFDRQDDPQAVDPRWNQAVNLFLYRSFKEYFRLSSDLKYDTLTTDRLLMLRAIYNATKELQLTAGVNLIGTPNTGTSYWSPYTNNDAIFGGLRYVF